MSFSVRRRSRAVVETSAAPSEVENIPSSLQTFEYVYIGKDNLVDMSKTIKSVKAKEPVHDLTDLDTVIKLDREHLSITNSFNVGSYARVAERYVSNVVTRYMNSIFTKKEFDKYVVSTQISPMMDHAYFSNCCVDISINKRKENELPYTDNGENLAILSFSLRELFNCSGVCISKMTRLEDNRYSSFPTTIVTDKIRDEAFQTDCTKFSMELAVDLCMIARYSNVLYICSDRETPERVRNYLAANWTSIHKFKNKRTSAGINYYIKDI
jgi:hypothetical protein